jgi:hypothetical protein
MYDEPPDKLFGRIVRNREPLPLPETSWSTGEEVMFRNETNGSFRVHRALQGCKRTTLAPITSLLLTSRLSLVPSTTDRLTELTLSFWIIEVTSTKALLDLVPLLTVKKILDVVFTASIEAVIFNFSIRRFSLHN